MIKRIYSFLIGSLLFKMKCKTFDPNLHFKNKRIAIIGSADSCLKEKNGEYIDGFDFVIRINKALVNWDKRHEDFIGSKTDILIHSFNENIYVGGGKLDFKIFREHKLRYLLNAKNRPYNKHQILNVYKKYKVFSKIYILKNLEYLECEELFKGFKPTNGFRALHMVLTSEAKEVYITGMTFFKTPYKQGYRDHVLDLKVIKKELKENGLHSPDLEFKLFLMLLKKSKGNVLMDSTLEAIIAKEENE